MIGEDYQDLDDFVDACKGRGSPLSSASVLGKIYSLGQLKAIAKYCNIEFDQIAATIVSQGGESSKGFKRRYTYAEAIAALRDVQALGKALSYVDHGLYFPVVTYFSLSDKGSHGSIDAFSHRLCESSKADVSGLTAFYDGLSNPPGPSVTLESVLINSDSNSASLLFSCTRVLLVPEGRQGRFEDYFLARVPVLARFLFSSRLLEISMPEFWEVSIAGYTSHTAWPERYQIIIETVMASLVMLTSQSPIMIDFKKLTLFLETVLGAKDMGWKIEPEAEAAFDLTQSVVPLRKILKTFSDSLEAECKRRGITSPLAGADLYNLFRALKEQSYTYSLVLEGGFGRRGGSVRTSAIYGHRQHCAFLWLARNDEHISRILQDAVCRSQTEEMTNPYDIASLITEKHGA
jgi:hypothetical protein